MSLLIQTREVRLPEFEAHVSTGATRTNSTESEEWNVQRRNRASPEGGNAIMTVMAPADDLATYPLIFVVLSTIAF